MPNIPTGEEDISSYGRARNVLKMPVDLSLVTASLTAEASHLGKIVDFDSASNLTYTVLDDAAMTAPFRTGNMLAVKRTGAGTVTFVAGAGVTVNTAEAGLVVTRHGVAFLMKDRAANGWTAYGKLSSS